MVIPHLTAIGLCLIAIVETLHLFHPIWYEQQSVALAVVIMWTLINVTLLSIGVGRLLSVSHRLRYRFPIVTDIRWRLTGNADWYSGHSINLSATGISFEHNHLHLSVSDNVEIAILVTIPDSELPVVKDPAPPTAGESKILFSGRVVGNYPAQLLDGTQRLCLVIDRFSSEADANNYAYLLHHPTHLLHGEEIFQPPESRANISKH
jgi:hypothetical protein